MGNNHSLSPPVWEWEGRGRLKTRGDFLLQNPQLNSESFWLWMLRILKKKGKKKRESVRLQEGIIHALENKSIEGY